MRTVELRCPVGPRRLLAKTVVAGEHPKIVEGNLVELSCDDCKRTLRQQGGPGLRVLHRYNLLGDLVESEEIF